MKNLIAASLGLIALSSSGAAVCQPLNTTQIGSWLYADVSDPMTDARGGVAGTQDTDTKAMFSVACIVSQKDRPLIYKLTYPKYETMGTMFVEILERFDDEKPSNTSWYNMKDGAFISGEKDIRNFNAKIFTAKQLRMRVKHRNDTFFDVQFPVEEAKAAIERVYAACGKSPKIAN